ncbi:hypothetical protein [Thalassotalea profundi]|uniref:LRAT domain-containing protein n=1 Tax=Thalassotalea profundi TaxID=2036687 RepID=A0ABQ3IZZ0_9GAMM|nr:hypothetical protein [Thalassotalea profundi]GHE98083.1 hypothetical protein GCM10011501_29500 [Thalassotalea profundi]
MPLPLLWLGAATLSAVTVKTLADDRKLQQQKRKQYRTVQTLSHLERHESPIATYPSEILTTLQLVKPKIGAIVCCGIGGVLDHTGIWVEDNMIIELDGEGLIKPISPRRFTKERSGKDIFIACDSNGEPLSCPLAASRAIEKIFTHVPYHMIDNNCHQFIWQCFKPNDVPLSTFKSLNLRLAQHFDRKIYWDLCDTKN